MPDHKLYNASNLPGEMEELVLKAQIGIYDFLEASKLLPDIPSSAGITYTGYDVRIISISDPSPSPDATASSRMLYNWDQEYLARKKLDSSSTISVVLERPGYTDEIDRVEFQIKIDHSPNNRSEVSITRDKFMTGSHADVSKCFTENVSSSLTRLQRDIPQLQAILDNAKQSIEEKTQEYHKSQERQAAAHGIAYIITAICIIIFIGFGIWGIFFNSAPSSSSQSREEEIAEDMEFLDNISTPGTSEYDWYHDKYLPDNGYPND